MKRITVYVVSNVVAFAILANFFFGNGGVRDFIQAKTKFARLQTQLLEKEFTLLSQESDLLSERSVKNIDERLLRHGYKQENTIIFRFVSSPSSSGSSFSTHLFSRLYFVFLVLIFSLLFGEVCLYLLSKGVPRL